IIRVLSKRRTTKFTFRLEDIEKVLAAAPKATVIASHMDNVGHATVWRKDIREFIARNGTAGRLPVPEDGETCCL
ncbi:MAG: hypothetical protein IJH79_06440, partial [Lentisphaeria bacterium]|nr:hypothetical protein [Lentisphaeria bacterium]